MFIIKESREDVNHLTCEQKLREIEYVGKSGNFPVAVESV